MRLTCVMIVLLMLLPAKGALAASSAWHEVEGGAIRLVTEDLPENGVLRGALQIRLAPGWKTYWRDPGEFGIPPQLDLSASEGITDVEIRYPPPQWIEENESSGWAGYAHSISLALLFSTHGAPNISADVFLGICRTICIPVMAQLEVEEANATIPEHARIVAEAFAALPDAASDRFGIVSASVNGMTRTLQLSLALPEMAESAGLFLAAPEGWRLGTPEQDPQEPSRFSVQVLDMPAMPDRADLAYTLVTGHAAVEGVVRIGEDAEAH